MCIKVDKHTCTHTHIHTHTHTHTHIYIYTLHTYASKYIYTCKHNTHEFYEERGEGEEEEEEVMMVVVLPKIHKANFSKIPDPNQTFYLLDDKNTVTNLLLLFCGWRL